MADKIRVLEAIPEEAGNTLRRENLIFYSLIDHEKEALEESEKAISDVCATNLGVSFEPRSIVRAHRLWGFNYTKESPIILKFISSQHKDNILGATKKLKNTHISKEDVFFSGSTTAPLEDLRKWKSPRYTI